MHKYMDFEVLRIIIKYVLMYVLTAYKHTSIYFCQLSCLLLLTDRR
jgi:hypothetical protein